MTVEWMTTTPNPRYRGGGVDAGQRGWRLHAVIDPVFDVLPSLWSGKRAGNRSMTKALCGARPAHGWGRDLFIDQECERCAVALEKIEANTTANAEIERTGVASSASNALLGEDSRR